MWHVALELRFSSPPTAAEELWGGPVDHEVFWAEVRDLPGVRSLLRGAEPVAIEVIAGPV